MPAKWDWPLASPLKLRANAVAIDWNPAPKRPSAGRPIAKREPPERITLIPYGCTKFRVSMFPVTERAWKAAESSGTKNYRISHSWHPAGDAPEALWMKAFLLGQPVVWAARGSLT